MNNLQLIEKVLYYIDEHICEELTYERLAEVFGYSSFHFHKIFSSVTELSITEYIRKRRLTIAHIMLCETTESVADICYRAGFNSIQTFHRVFKNTFGMQPLAARERQAKVTYRSVEEIITGYLKRIAVEGVFSIEPRFEEREEFVIAGYRKHTRDGFDVIGESWFELKSGLAAIERKNKHTMYGFEDYSEEFCSEPLSFYYMAGVEVGKDTPLQDGMYRKVVQKAKYAVFTVNGNNANGEIGEAFKYIYFVWLPNFEGYKKPHDWNKERELRAEASRVKGFKGKREYPWVVVYQGEVIGQIQLFHFFNHNTCAEVGYFIKKTYWNLGINTKVLKAVCRFGIETMGLERIEAFVHHFPKPKPCEISCLYGQDCVFAPLAKLCNFGTVQMKAA